MALIQTPEGQAVQDTMTAQNAVQAPVQTLAPAPAAPAAAGPEALGTVPASNNALPSPVDAALQLRVNAPPPGSFGSKLAQALDQTPLELKPNGKPAPGAWAKSLIGAAQTALSGLGDIPNEKAPVGAGVISGISGTLANRNQRLAAAAAEKHKEQIQDDESRRADEAAARQKKMDQLNNAHAAQLQLAENNNAYRTNTVEPLVASDKKLFDLMTDPTNIRPAEVVKEGLDGDQVKQWVIDHHSQDPNNTSADYNYFATGVKTSTEGKSQATYSIVRPGGPVTLSDSDKPIIDLVNKFAPQSQPLVPGVTIPSVDLNTLVRQASVARQASLARDQAAESYGLEEDKIKDLKDFTDPRFSNVYLQVGNAKGVDQNPVKIAALLAAKVDPNSKSYDPNFAKAFPNPAEIVRQHFEGPKGEDNFTRMQEKQTEIDEAAKDRAAAKATDNATKLHDLLTDDMKLSISQLPPDKQSVLGQYTPEQQAAIVSIGTSPGDVNFRDVFTRMAKGQEGLTPQQAEAAIKQVYPHWSMAAYQNTQKMYKDITGGGKLSDDIGKYNNVLQHASDAQDALTQAMDRSKLPAIGDTALSAIQKRGYSAEYGKLALAVGVVKNEYELLSSGGYKPSAAEEETVNSALSPNATPNQISAALKVLASIGAVRLNQINDRYKANSGRDIPGILSPDSVDAANHLNVDPKTRGILSRMNVGGNLFGSDKEGNPDNGHYAKDDLYPKTAAPAPAQNIVPGTVKKFQNGNVGVWDGKGWAYQAPQQVNQ